MVGVGEGKRIMDEAYMYVRCKSNLFEAMYKAKTNVLMVVM